MHTRHMAGGAWRSGRLSVRGGGGGGERADDWLMMCGGQCVREEECWQGAFVIFCLYLKQRNGSFERLFVRCILSASMEKNRPHPSGVTALSAAKMSGRGVCFEVG